MCLLQLEDLWKGVEGEQKSNQRTKHGHCDVHRTHFHFSHTRCDLCASVMRLYCVRSPVVSAVTKTPCRQLFENILPCYKVQQQAMEIF